jgi:3-hydroxybutyryl-CoA dehydrogenase
MFNLVGVVGAGQMGSGIAHVLALHRYAVRLYDLAEAQLPRALKTIEQNLERQAKKGIVEASAIPAILSRIEAARALSDLSACDLAIEAVNENETLKFDLFRQLDSLLSPEAILASNTSSISITRIAAVTRRPDKVIGLHFMYPVPLMQLVEVIRGLETSEATFEAASSLVATLDKTSVVVQDYPGFLVNRILIPMINEAIFVLYEGIATAEDIDKGMKLGTNQPMGPLALADVIGLDTVLAILNVLYEGFKDPKYRPCPLLVNLVQAGRLGKKSGRGFYTY